MLNRSSWIYHDAPEFDGGANRYSVDACMAFPMGCAGWGDPNVPLAAANRYEKAGLEIRRLLVSTDCYAGGGLGPPDCPPVSVRSFVAIYSARISLRDREPPTFTTPPNGTLFEGVATLEGSRTASFTAEDRGGGLLAAAISVDGHLLNDQHLAPDDADCQPPYTAPVPCPLKSRGTLDLDTTALANGPHAIAIALTDAAGNRTLSPAVGVIVHNPGLPNGTRASWFARLDAWFEGGGRRHRAVTTASYGRSPGLTGVVLDEHGHPIAGSTLDVSVATSRAGAVPKPLPPVITDGHGRFHYLPRTGASREFTLSYRAFGFDDAPSATAKLTLRVRAWVTLAVRPRRPAPGGVIHFSGRLRGGPGRAGTQIVIYALAAGARKRIPVTTLRAVRADVSTTAIASGAAPRGRRTGSRRRSAPSGATPTQPATRGRSACGS
jgi:hypothetical protein